jgi:hypothetical protein
LLNNAASVTFPASCAMVAMARASAHIIAFTEGRHPALDTDPSIASQPSRVPVE